MKDNQSLPDRNSSVTDLIALLRKHTHPCFSLHCRHYDLANGPCTVELLRQAEITANRIIYHAQFALDHLSGGAQ